MSVKSSIVAPKNFCNEEHKEEGKGAEQWNVNMGPNESLASNKFNINEINYNYYERTLNRKGKCGFIKQS